MPDASVGPYMSFFHSFNTNLYFIDYINKVHEIGSSHDKNEPKRRVLRRLGPAKFFFLTIYTPIHRIILKHITLHYVDVEIKFDPLFTF